MHPPTVAMAEHATSDTESLRSELEELRLQDALLRETSREELLRLQDGLAALTATVDQREHARREQSEHRLSALRELQGALASHGSTKRARVRRRPFSAGQTARRSRSGRATRRPHSAHSSRDSVALAVGGRKSARTVARATGAVKELGRNSLTLDEHAVAAFSTVRRSSSTHNRDCPWREGGDLTVKPSAAEIVAASLVSDKRQKSFSRKVATQSQLYKDVIMRSDVDWDHSLSRPQHAGQRAHTAFDIEHRNAGSIDKILSTTDELLGLESEITGKWRRSHCPKAGPVQLRSGGKSLMARSSKTDDSSSASVLQPRRDTNPSGVAGSSRARHKAEGLTVELPEYNASDSDDPHISAVSAASAVLGMRSEDRKEGDPESPLEIWAHERAIQSAKKKIKGIAEQQETDRLNKRSEELAMRGKMMFSDLDSDNSGTLDPRELQALASALGSTLSDHEISEAMSQVDKDGSGGVDLYEFLEWYMTDFYTYLSSWWSDLGCS